MSSQVTIGWFLCVVLFCNIFVNCGSLGQQLIKNKARVDSDETLAENSADFKSAAINGKKAREDSDSGTSATPSLLPTTVVTKLKNTESMEENALELTTSSQLPESVDTRPSEASSRIPEITTNASKVAQTTSQLPTTAFTRKLRQNNNVTSKVTKAGRTETTPKASSTPTVASTTTEINNQIMEAEEKTTTSPKTTITPVYGRGCFDKLSTRSCKSIAKKYAAYDLCKVLKAMRIHCRKYCGLCGIKKQGLEKPMKKKRACKDFSKIFCKRFRVHCFEDSSNGKKMRHICRKTCHVC